MLMLIMNLVGEMLNNCIVIGGCRERGTGRVRRRFLSTNSLSRSGNCPLHIWLRDRDDFCFVYV
jgi:hypothetical protein